MINTIKQVQQKPLLSRAFFGKNNCLKIILNLQKECYFQFGAQKEDCWVWKNVKFSDIELGDMLLVLRGKSEKTSFYHKYGDTATQIWVNRFGDTLNIKTKEISKSLSTGEQEVLRILLERVIVHKSTAL